jgi:hypothetical protein
MRVALVLAPFVGLSPTPPEPGVSFIEIVLLAMIISSPFGATEIGTLFTVVLMPGLSVSPFGNLMPSPEDTIE